MSAKTICPKWFCKHPRVVHSLLGCEQKSCPCTNTFMELSPRKRVR